MEQITQISMDDLLSEETRRDPIALNRTLSLRGLTSLPMTFDAAV